MTLLLGVIVLIYILGNFVLDYTFDLFIFSSSKGVASYYDTKFAHFRCDATSGCNGSNVKELRSGFISPSLQHTFTHACATVSFQQLYDNTFNFLRDIEFRLIRVSPYCETIVCRTGLSSWRLLSHLWYNDKIQDKRTKEPYENVCIFVLKLRT
jgi:hypothetical protein